MLPAGARKPNKSRIGFRRFIALFLLCVALLQLRWWYRKGGSGDDVDAMLPPWYARPKPSTHAPIIISADNDAKMNAPRRFVVNDTAALAGVRPKHRLNTGAPVDIAFVIPLRAKWFPHDQIVRLLRSAEIAEIPVSITVVASYPFDAKLIVPAYDKLGYPPEVRIVYVQDPSAPQGKPPPTPAPPGDANLLDPRPAGGGAVPKIGEYFEARQRQMSDGPSMLDLMSKGMDAAPSGSTFFFFMSPTHMPSGDHFVSAMISQALVHQEDLGILGCTTTFLTPAGVASSHAVGEEIILDHGQEVQSGTVSKRRRYFATRRHAGFNVRDARLITEEVPLVSLYCALMHRQAVLAAKFNPAAIEMHRRRNLGSAAESTRFSSRPIDRFLSMSNMTNIHLITDILGHRIKMLDDYLSSLTIAEVSKGSTALRHAVQSAYSIDTRAIQIWESLSRKNWRDQVFNSAIRRDILGEEMEAEETQLWDWVNASKTKTVKIMRAKNLAEEALQAAEQYSKSGYGNLPVEEEILYDVALRLRETKFSKIMISDVTARISSHTLSPTDLYHGIYTRQLFAPSHVLSSVFVTKWTSVLSGWSPALNSTLGLHGRSKTAKNKKTSVSQAAAFLKPVNVIWYAYCCKCCGFLNEMSSLIPPLQSLRNVQLLPDLSCFCPGMALSVQDTVERLHWQKDNELGVVGSYFNVYISHTDPSLYDMVKGFGFSVDYFIGRSMYEFSRIAERHAEIAQEKRVDEIWVPSEFSKKVYIDSGVNASKIVIIPEAIDTYLFDPDRTVPLPSLPAPPSYAWKTRCNHQLLPATADGKPRFRFLSDFKWESRKGWEILLQAYIQNFTRNDPVSLFILTHKHIWDPAKQHERSNVDSIVEEIREKVISKLPKHLSDVTKHPHYCLIVHDATADEVAQVYKSVDAFVLPTRGEGWGLPAMQAMSMALPTISTNWGGSLAFMNSDNSFLIELDGVEEIPGDSEYEWQPGKKWATPSINHTAALMRFVMDNRAHAKAVGRRARAHIAEHFSEAAVAKVVDNRIAWIQSMLMEKEEQRRVLAERSNEALKLAAQNYRSPQ